MKRKGNVKKSNVKKSKIKKKNKKTNIKNVKNNSIKKTVKRKQKNPKMVTQKHLITQIIATPIPIQNSPKIIETGFSKTNWRNIYDICENAIQIYKMNHSWRNVDKDLRDALNNINRIAQENGILNDIQFILRSRQILIDKIKLIKNYCLRMI